MTTRLGHYRLFERVGAGGMGEVFRAHDLALDRPAAVKIIKPELVAEHRARVLREARASARLQHPAIATFYDAGTEGDRFYIGMEFVAGQTLQRRLREGPLSDEDFWLLSTALLTALAHAHAAGVLHRDVKPGNLMITPEGRMKLLDFGLARISSVEGDATLTAMTMPGTIMGTPGYMAPEQIRGKATDERSDLFAAAAVLTEARSGRVVFDGGSALERAATTLAVTDHPTLTPADRVSEVLQRALASDPSHRPRTASEMLAALRDASEAPDESALPSSWSVTEFENLAGNQDDDWIGRALADNLRVEISTLPGAEVISGERLLQARREREAQGRDCDPLSLGQHLGCRWMLAGSYQQMGPALRVTARLLDVPTGKILGTRKADGAAADFFAIQDEIACGIAEEAGRTLPGTAAPKSSKSALDLVECVARAQKAFDRGGRDGLAEAERWFMRALDQRPDDPIALTGMCALHAMRYTFLADDSDLDRCLELGRRALASDPERAPVHPWMAYACLRRGHTEEAIAWATRAKRDLPHDHMGVYFGACAHLADGRPDDSLPLFREALSRHRAHGWSWLGLGSALLGLGRSAEARYALHEAVDLERPDVVFPTAGTGCFLAEALRREGQLDEAWRVGQEALDRVEASDFVYRDLFLALCLRDLGRIARDRGDLEAARVSFERTLGHLQARPRILGSGFVAVQCLAGLASAGGAPDAVEQARDLLSRRDRFDFSWQWSCTGAEAQAWIDEAQARLG